MRDNNVNTYNIQNGFLIELQVKRGKFMNDSSSFAINGLGMIYTRITHVQINQPLNGGGGATQTLKIVRCNCGLS